MVSYQILAVAEGEHHALLLLDNGKIYCWGDNEDGQLGDGTTTDSKRPCLVKGIPGQVLAIATGDRHSLVLLESGQVFGWGSNELGQLGDRTTLNRNRPQLIEGIPGKVVSVAAGSFHSLVLLESGEIYGCGRNMFGQLGDVTTTDRNYMRLVRGLPSKIIDISAGDYHSLALTENGRVYSWGRNSYGQLGDGTTNDRNLPHLIEGIPGKVASVKAGDYHSLVLLKSGKVYGCGYNPFGQASNRTTQDTSRWQIIEAIPGKVVSIAAGDYHSLALLDSGKIYGWGSNYDGRLGNSKTHPLLTPKLVPKIDKRILLGVFGKGGRAVNISVLENKFRELLAQEFYFKEIFSNNLKRNR